MITTLRRILVTDLTTGYAVTGTGHVPRVTVTEGWPSRVSTPAVTVEPGDPYVTVGQTFGAFDVRIDITLLVARDLADLDAMIETALLNTADWGMAGVSMPRPMTYAGVEMIGCTISLIKQDKL